MKLGARTRLYLAGLLAGLAVGGGAVTCSRSAPPDARPAPEPPPRAATEREALPPPRVAEPPSDPGQGGPPPLFAADRGVRIDDLPWEPSAAAVLQADAHLGRGDAAAALASLDGVAGSAAAIVRARAHRAQSTTGSSLAAAQGAIDAAGDDPILATRVALERGLLAARTGDHAAAVTFLLPLLDESPSLSRRAAQPLAAAMAVAAPERFVEIFARLEAALPKDLSSRSLLLAMYAGVLDGLGRPDDAGAVRLRRYLEEPIAPETPTAPPAGVPLTAQQRLARLEVLLEAHRNERVLEEGETIPEDGLDQDAICRRRFALGLAHRKLHHYTDAEKHLGWVIESCTDDDLVRRAWYINAKVISITSGLRAIAAIDRFAERFVGHSMVDDVLFWAGDLYQRRRRDAEARAYFRRIEEQTTKGDHCADARWRQGWMLYRAGDLDAASTALERTFNDDGCSDGDFDRARADYWLGRIAQARGDGATAARRYESVIERTALGWYGQLAIKRLLALEPDRRGEWAERLRAPEGSGLPASCPGALAADPALNRGAALLLRGLGSDAAEELLAIELPKQEVVATAHAASQGIDPKRAEKSSEVVAEGCRSGDPSLLLALLLDRAGAHHEAHWRLRTEFAAALETFPGPREVGLFRAAYPLAFRVELEAAEAESALPPMLLQALSREESAFDAEVVSWAGAYGLTQLLFRTGQRAGEMLKPPVRVNAAEDLLDPKLNARLGGALMASLLRRFDRNVPLSLVAYNASESFAHTLWKRHVRDELDVFAEEISIHETRGYVMRVAKTFGVYRWLYGGEPPELPIALTLPDL